MSELVSIIVPIYNVEQYLDRCLRSIQMQSYRSIQVIMVDDGSTDQSGEIAKRYQDVDHRFRLVSKQNGGLSSARNLGLSCVDGAYVSFVDADDFLSPRYVEILVGYFDDTTDVCVGDYVIYDGTRQRAYKHTGHIEAWSCSTIEGKKQLMYQLMQPGSQIMPVWKNMYRKTFLQENELKFVSERAVYAEDKLFNVQAYAMARNVKIIPEIVYYHLIVPGSLSQGYRSNIYEMLIKLEDMVQMSLHETFDRDFLSGLTINDGEIISNACLILCKCHYLQAYENVRGLLQKPQVNKALCKKNPHFHMWRHKVLFYALKTKKTCFVVLLAKGMLLMNPLYRIFQKKTEYPVDV